MRAPSPAGPRTRSTEPSPRADHGARLAHCQCQCIATHWIASSLSPLESLAHLPLPTQQCWPPPNPSAADHAPTGRGWGSGTPPSRSRIPVSRMAAAGAAQGPRGHRRRSSGGGGGAARARWCCAFAGATNSPDLRPLPSPAAGRKLPPKSPTAASFYGSASPTSSRLAGLGGLIDPRRILSPGRVSPIDPDGAQPPPLPLPLPPPPPSAPAAAHAVEQQEAVIVPAERANAVSVAPVVAAREEEGEGGAGALDLRLLLRGRDGRCVLMELDSGVLCGCSAFFAAMAPAEDAGEAAGGGGGAGRRIEVDGVDNLDAFKAAVELMYAPDPVRWLAAAGVSRAIDVLERYGWPVWNQPARLHELLAIPGQLRGIRKLAELSGTRSIVEVHTRCGLLHGTTDVAPTPIDVRCCGLWQGAGGAAHALTRLLLLAAAALHADGDTAHAALADVRCCVLPHAALPLPAAAASHTPLLTAQTAHASRSFSTHVCSSIMFSRGIRSCLTYIEAVPWNENEEEKLKNLLARFTFDDAISQDILARLRPHSWKSSDDLTVQLIQSVTSSTNTGARKDMQSLVNGLLSKSSVYQKDSSGLNKDSLYQICYSCLESLVDLFEEATEPTYHICQAVVVRGSKPLIERVSSQTENLNWLLDILVNNDIAEDFVELWAKQDRLISMHEQASAMIRYELSRISAGVFIALGKGKVQCRGEVRSLLFDGWFSIMLLDFGWLQRCSKGLDLRSLEENLGRGLLTLPLRQQQCFFEEWFQFYATKGGECPNLIRAFQVWWRRSFIRSSVERQS
ncbi:hypothetical protein U9M48_012356 [Paspalum notatum var. saurae]|uniref:At3g05675-like ankyrin-like domain-containing protein n=1 Tax=Paspalum notatum var. saurae TaxID=547442 RepID=A0AAQ3WIM1_PASNO